MKEHKQKEKQKEVNELKQKEKQKEIKKETEVEKKRKWLKVLINIFFMCSSIIAIW